MHPPVPTVYLIRHATPDWSRTDIPYFTLPGPPLTAQGQDEAAQLGVFLREARVAQLFASPFERAWRTAQIAVTIANVPVQQAEGLAEWQPGENGATIRARFWPVWDQACDLGLRVGPVALVTHGGPIGFLLEELGLAKEVLAQHRKQFDRNNPLPPAGAWKATRGTLDTAWDLSLAFVPARDGAPGVGYV